MKFVANFIYYKTGKSFLSLKFTSKNSLPNKTKKFLFVVFFMTAAHLDEGGGHKLEGFFY